MKNFTDFKEKWIESTIASHMKIICKEILKKIKNIESILLVGGFGRGEGSIKIIGENKLIPLKDYDLIVVTNSNISGKDYIKLVQNIHNTLKIPSYWYAGAAPGQFHINIKLVRKRSLSRLPPDISNYEIKEGSRVLYGLDIRKLIPILKKDIGYMSGLRILLNKAIGLLEYFPKDPLLYRENINLKESLIYECGKTYIEIATALTIIMGCYEPSYKHRAINFEKNFEKKLPRLSNIIPNLSYNVKFFTKLKLRSNFNEVELDPIDLWYSVKKDLLKVIFFYYEWFSGKKVENPLSFIEKFSKFLELNYFSSYLNYYFKNFWWSNRFLIYLASSLIHFYENFRFLRNLSVQKHLVLLKSFLSKRSPIIKIHCVAILTLISIDDTNYKKSLINSAWHLLKSVYPLNNKIKDTVQKLNLLRTTCLDAFKIYQLKKIRKSTF
ncbi:MAG: hypothetical protein ACTSRG_04995 [Candidatus Helarchaeota archaeon]